MSAAAEVIGGYGPDNAPGESGATPSRPEGHRVRARQDIALTWLSVVAERGATWQELGRRMQWSHGSASSALSHLHRAGAVARLAERRNRCGVYVLPAYIQGRETAPYRPNAAARGDRVPMALDPSGLADRLDALADRYRADGAAIPLLHPENRAGQRAALAQAAQDISDLLALYRAGRL